MSSMAAFTFFAKTHPGDTCGSNGLPLTPNSIVILGRSQFLKSINHDNLCEYLDVIRSKHERTIVISEYTGAPLNEVNVRDNQIILRIFYQIANGLDHIHRLGLAVQNLEPKNVLIDSAQNVKLFNYGMYHQTNRGEYVTFPIGNIRYMSPERLLGSKDNIKSDVWSLAIIIIELIFGAPIWPSLNTAQYMRKILSLINTRHVLEKIARECNHFEKYSQLDTTLRTLLELCLSISPKERPLPKQILENVLFTENLNEYRYTCKKIRDSLVDGCPLKQIYYWWQLAGGDVHSELKAIGLIRNEAPIMSIPKLVLLSGYSVGHPRSQSYMYDNRNVILSLSNLNDRMANIEKQAYNPLILSERFMFKYDSGMKTLPLIIRERDTEYQLHRVSLFAKLLKGYPYTHDRIILESETDIPPLMRGEIWACLLGVLENNSYEGIDKVSPTSTDRQIEVDIPRCHQYDELLSSPEGHQKLKRLLKAWVTSHPQYVYWQGLDSLTAPFLYLNFSNEERAFLSLSKFIPKYLHWFFLKDNSQIIKEYLSKFSQLTAFHEPILANHLTEINFIPELFAIPWFLTMFSHVFPLHKIIHLWDKLILGDNSYPLFIGISILQQLKTTLLGSCFNECILLFSDLPDIVMETCVIESQKMYLSTPKSVTYRKNVLHEINPNEFDVSGIELQNLQYERCPRISANDLVKLLTESPDEVVIIDLRNNLEFKRAHVKDSINIPFSSVTLSDVRLNALNITGLEQRLTHRIVVVASTMHENAVLFSKHLLECGTARVCTLHNGFNLLHSFVPNVLLST